MDSGGSREVPLHLRNAPTRLIKEMDHGAEYRYAHDEEGGYAAGENYFPEELQGPALLRAGGSRAGKQDSEKFKYLRELDNISARQRYPDDTGNDNT